MPKTKTASVKPLQSWPMTVRVVKLSPEVVAKHYRRFAKQVMKNYNGRIRKLRLPKEHREQALLKSPPSVTIRARSIVLTADHWNVRVNVFSEASAAFAGQYYQSLRFPSWG